MKARQAILAALGAAAGLALAVSAANAAAAAAAPEWRMNATIIESCSCPMFCQCYFNTKPAAHHEHGGGGKHFCKANLAYQVNKGSYGDVNLDGAKFWLTGDLGGDFSKMETEWGILTFDKSVAPAQRAAIEKIYTYLMPFKWQSFKTAEGMISWTATPGEARALLDGGKTAEIHLMAAAQTDTAGQPIVIKNLQYFGSTTNDGFVLMPAVLEAYRVGDKAFEFKGTNGFMITFDIDSKSVAPAAGSSY